jgi:hypothetical protein
MVDDVVPAAEIKRLNDEPAGNGAEHSTSNGKFPRGKIWVSPATRCPRSRTMRARSESAGTAA